MQTGKPNDEMTCFPEIRGRHFPEGLLPLVKRGLDIQTLLSVPLNGFLQTFIEMLIK